MKNNKQEIASLRASGLSDREAVVWFAIAEIGAANISAIAAEAATNRPAVYAALEDLQEKGLVQQVMSGKRVHYQTTGKKTLQAWQKNTRTDLDQKLNQLPRNDNVGSLGDVVVLKGDQIAAIWEEISRLKRGSVVYRYDGYDVDQDTSQYKSNDWYEVIDRRNIDRFVITNRALRESAFKNRMECDSKIFPEKFDAFEHGAITWIYEDKIAHIDLKSEIAYVIKNATISSYHRRIFEYSYRNLTDKSAKK